MCLFLPFVFFVFGCGLLVVGCWFYSEINNNTHNQQPTTNNQKPTTHNRKPTTNNQTAISISEIRIL